MSSSTISSSVKVIVGVTSSSIIRPTRAQLSESNVSIPIPGEWLLDETRKSIAAHMLPLAAMETISALSEDFTIYPLWTRPVKWVSGELRNDSLTECEIQFQVGRSALLQFQTKKSHGLWFAHHPSGNDMKPSAIELKSSTTVLNRRTILLYVANFVEVRTEARGIDPPIWMNTAGVAPALNEQMVKVRARAFFIDKSYISNVDNVVSESGKVGLTFIGSLVQYIKAARMFAMPERPLNMTVELDYNVSPLYDAIFFNGSFDSSIYQPNQTLPQKYRALVATTKPSVLLVDGGPGTGKSTNVANAILLQMAAHQGPNRPKVLVTAPSNAATDVLFLKLFKGVEQSKLSIVVRRTGDKTKFKPEVTRIVSADEARFHDNLRAEEESLAVNTEPISATELRKLYLLGADILAVTLGSVQARELSCIRHHLNFSILVIDECGQASFNEILLPLYFCSLTKLVLIGDPKQLGPTLKWSGFNSYSPDDTSLFVRVYKYLLAHKDTAVCSLREQRRMRRFVAEIVSQISYNDKQGRLVTLPDGNWRNTLHLPECAIFSGRDFLESPSPRSYSFENENEHKFGLILLEASLRQAGFDWVNKRWPDNRQQLAYSIISLYRGQYNLFHRTIQALGLNNFVNVSTVDQMQGSECDVAILSSVRASQEHMSVGFACDLRRLNVALSRAACIYVLSKVDDFSTYQGWNVLMQKAAGAGRLFINADQYETAEDVLGLLQTLVNNPVYPGE